MHFFQFIQKVIVFLKAVFLKAETVTRIHQLQQSTASKLFY